MMASGKDSSEVVRFISVFEKLKDWSDNDPEGLHELARNDEGVKDLCIQICDAAHKLTMNERRKRELFVAPVDPKFLAIWRDYENRFEGVVAGIWLEDLALQLL
jgi:hypothetical protein